MVMLDQCPGAEKLRRPSIIIKTCPECGEEIELFTTDAKMDCPGCGFTVYNDAMSCVQWCKYARECVGDEIYEEMMKRLETQVPDTT